MGEVDLIAVYFSSKENCYMDLRYVKELYRPSTTQEQAKQAYKALHLMVMHCPAELIGVVESAINEFELRMRDSMGFNLTYKEGVGT